MTSKKKNSKKSDPVVSRHKTILPIRVPAVN